ncbi:tripartite motif-containing protein 2-like [Branchiostoma floridae x Branchiostoma japonicum]
MASGVTSQIKEEFLVCQICFEDYYEPKVLPCQHTFCQGCLETIVKKMGKLTCPNCRRECPLPQNGVKGFPTSFFVNKLRDIIANGDGATRTSSCASEGKMATSHNAFYSDYMNIPASQHAAATSDGHANSSLRHATIRVLLPFGRYGAINDFFFHLYLL